MYIFIKAFPESNEDETKNIPFAAKNLSTLKKKIKELADAKLIFGKEAWKPVLYIDGEVFGWIQKVKVIDEPR